MPMFFFHIRLRGAVVTDMEGSELADAVAAEAEAHEIAADLLAEAVKTRTTVDKTIEVHDADDRHIVSVPLLSAILHDDDIAGNTH